MTKSENKKILVLALSGIGNFLMQSPALTALKKAYPGSHITVWVAPRGTRILAENHPAVDEVIEEPIKRSFMQHLSLVRRLRRERFNIGIVLSPGQLIKSAAYLWLAGIPQRISHQYPLGNNPHSHFLLTVAIPEEEGLHDIEQNLRLLEPLGIKAEPKYYELSIPEKNKQEAGRWLAKHPLAADKKFVGFHLGSAPDFPWKRWPIQNFIAVGKKIITKQNMYILLFGGSDEKELKEKAKSQLGENATNVDIDLLTTAALIQHCTLFLSNDSGLMHLAAAVGVKTFGLFGPTDERKTGPRGPQSFIIRAPGTAPAYNTEKNYFLGNEPYQSMRAITPDLVLDKIPHAVSQ